MSARAPISKASTPKETPVRLPAFERHTTRSGLEIHAARRGPLPLIALRLLVRAGSSTDPVGKEGLADFAARLLRRGTKSLSADQLDEAVESVGAHLGVGCSEDLLSIGITTPTEHLDAMLEVLGKLVVEPSFPAKEVESARARALAQHANELDDPSSVADRTLIRALWGSHPYGHEVSGGPRAIASFGREDLVSFMRSRVGPKVAALIVVGDADPKSIFRRAEAAFAGWKGGPDSAEPLPTLEHAAAEGEVIVIDKPEQTQAQIRVAGLAFRRGAEDFFPARVMNVALGEGFTSRLVEAVRVNRGLSYYVGTHFDPMRAGGTFQLSTFTKTESTKEILEVALEQIAQVRKGGVTPKELTHAKQYLSGLYPLRLETNEALAGAKAEILFYDLPEDWVERYRERLWAVTPKSAREVAGRHLFARKPTIVVVGNAEKIRPLVTSFGKVTVRALSEVD